MAINNSDLHLPDAFTTNNPATKKERAELDAAMDDLTRWHERMRPLFETGNAWIGIWHNPETGLRQIEVSVAVDPKQPNAWEFAKRLGRHQDQIGIFDLEQIKGDNGYEHLGGSGGIPYTAENPGTKMVPTPKKRKSFYT